MPARNRLGWYLRRASSMSPAEIGYRIRQRVRIESERLFRDDHAALFPTSVHQFPHSLKQKMVLVPYLHTQTSLIDEWKHLFPEGKSATVQASQNLCAQRFELFGRVIELPDQIPWQEDPLTGLRWPTRYWADVNVRDGQTIGGVKWIWELNRHYHWVTLSKAYFLTGNEEYATQVCAQFAHWIESNKPKVGVNWTSSLEMALRIINWSFAFSFISSSVSFSPELRTAVYQSVNVQANHIASYLSFHSSANNHLIGEAAGLVFAGICFPDLTNAPKWLELGRSILENELSRQILPDGVPAEQTPDYLCFIIDFNLLVWRLVEDSGNGTVPQIWYSQFEAAANYIMHLLDDMGNVPSIGDSDDAWVVRLDDRYDANNFRSILASAAAILQRSDFKAAAGKWDEKSQWILGDEGKQRFDALPEVKPSLSSVCFSEGGYGIMRSCGRHIVVDCGPLGYLSTAAHGHADALSVLVSIEGIPMLIDAGTYAYQEGGTWRSYFRGTSAHNTVLIDGIDQSEIQGDFLWGQKANTQLLHWHSCSEFDQVVAQHDGYRSLGVVHKRSVFYFKPHLLIVIDDLLGQGVHKYEQLWHFPASSAATVSDLSVNVINHIVHCTIELLEGPVSAASIYRGELDPIQGWISRHYGHKEPAPVLGFRGRATLPVRLATAVILHDTVSEHDVDHWKNRAYQLLAELKDTQ